MYDNIFLVLLCYEIWIHIRVKPRKKLFSSEVSKSGLGEESQISLQWWHKWGEVQGHHSNQTQYLEAHSSEQMSQEGRNVYEFSMRCIRLQPKKEPNEWSQKQWISKVRSAIFPPLQTPQAIDHFSKMNQTLPQIQYLFSCSLEYWLHQMKPKASIQQEGSRRS